MVVLPKLLHKKICSHAERVYPAECCGLLLGEATEEVKSVRDILETDNDAEDMRHKRYSIPPRALFDAENLARENGWEVIGVYHSHPDHPAQPSKFDRERAIVRYEYLIVGIDGGNMKEVKCWILKDWDSVFEREDLLISD